DAVVGDGGLERVNVDDRSVSRHVEIGFLQVGVHQPEGVEVEAEEVVRGVLKRLKFTDGGDARGVGRVEEEDVRLVLFRVEVGVVVRGGQRDDRAAAPADADGRVAVDLDDVGVRGRADVEPVRNGRVDDLAREADGDRGLRAGRGGNTRAGRATVQGGEGHVG